jgi:hypothetical protein
MVIYDQRREALLERAYGKRPLHEVSTGRVTEGQSQNPRRLFPQRGQAPKVLDLMLPFVCSMSGGKRNLL